MKIKRRLDDPCQVIAMRDVDVNFITQFITRPDSEISTVEDLIGRRFAFGSRGSVEAGLLAYHFLKESGINPRVDLSAYTFYDERDSGTLSDQEDVIERVRAGEYDAGAASKRALEVSGEQGTLPEAAIRVFWSSPGYSHCCFTAQGDMDATQSDQILQALLSLDYGDPIGKAVLDGEGCLAFMPGITVGWETLEKVAEEEGLI